MRAYLLEWAIDRLKERSDKKTAPLRNKSSEDERAGKEKSGSESSQEESGEAKTKS